MLRVINQTTGLIDYDSTPAARVEAVPTNNRIALKQQTTFYASNKIYDATIFNMGNYYNSLNMAGSLVFDIVNKSDVRIWTLDSNYVPTLLNGKNIRINKESGLIYFTATETTLAGNVLSGNIPIGRVVNKNGNYGSAILKVDNFNLFHKAYFECESFVNYSTQSVNLVIVSGGTREDSVFDSVVSTAWRVHSTDSNGFITTNLSAIPVDLGENKFYLVKTDDYGNKSDRYFFKVTRLNTAYHIPNELTSDYWIPNFRTNTSYLNSVSSTYLKFIVDRANFASNSDKEKTSYTARIVNINNDSILDTVCLDIPPTVVGNPSINSAPLTLSFINPLAITSTNHIHGFGEGNLADMGVPLEFIISVTASIKLSNLTYPITRTKYFKYVLTP